MFSNVETGNEIMDDFITGCWFYEFFAAFHFSLKQLMEENDWRTSGTSFYYIFLVYSS